MQTSTIEPVSNPYGCSQTEAQEYLDSETRYLCELQETNDLRGDDIGMVCSNLRFDLDYQEYFINHLVGA